ncbi:flagella assembly protein FlgT middle domain-containing protein [Candidatus Ferrigenium straubiae]|jgi:hypothetical protein|uniref:flagella assembly protein FlgT middle domain-containing protein n=1 Tax=Candidatus Ferrigenium straubiae TaxID=2919506 RepID=UPI003F4AE3B2
MPFNIRQGSRCAASLVTLFCMMVALCAAPVAAQTEGTEGAQEGAARAAKRKIAFAQFDVANTLHVDDINNIYDGLPLALASRLEASGEFLAAYSGCSIPAEAGDAQREVIIGAAAESGAQFLVSGVVVNAGTKQEKGYLGTPIGGGAKRHIEVELAVYDGLTGNRLMLRRLGEQAQGEVRVGNDKPFGSSIFFETEFGQATNRLLDLAVKDIRATLEKMPFSANIIRVEGKKAYLDAGSDARLKAGDQFVVYVRDAAPVVGLKGAVLGATDRAADTLTLTEVQPQFSIGELTEEAVKLGIGAGNVARIDPVEQRALVARQIAAQQAAKAEQEARDEAERVKKEQAVREEAARVEAKQAEAARIKAEKEAKAQADAEAKAAKLKAAQETKARRLSAAQEAHEREKAQIARNAARAKREAAKAEAERIKAEKKAVAEAKKQADAAAKLKAEQEAKAEAERVKAEKAVKAKAEGTAQAKEQPAAESRAGAAPKSAREKTTSKNPPGMEVRAVAIEDLQREAAEAAAAASAPQENKKPGVPLKLKQIKP